jgi:putative sterol carrier protein
MARYLSLHWIDELRSEVEANPELASAAAGQTLGVTQLVTAGPEGDVTYHLQVDEGAVRFGAGPADPEDVRLEQSWETAVAVATGTLNAQEAFIRGGIKLHGDPQRLLGAVPLFAALDGVFASVRERTEYR